MAHLSESRTDYGLGLQATFLETFVFLSLHSKSATLTMLGLIRHEPDKHTTLSWARGDGGDVSSHV
jgi:hypothetical protein